jgi:glycosyltransferase involved in cell wall biosynthesis
LVVDFEMSSKVTIGVCVRNGAATIREAIESIIAQDYPHHVMEVIFVDDGSEDDTLSLINSYVSKMDMPVKVFHHEWRGLGASRNIAVDNASGKYLVWVDGDMVLSKNFIRKLVDFMDMHPKIGIAKGKQALEPGKNIVATLETYARAASRMVDYESQKMHAKSLGTGGAIYRTDVLRRVGCFDENLKGYGEDFDIEIRVKAAGYWLSTINSEFLDYERHGLTWKHLWSRYWLRGYYSHYFLHKNTGTIKLYTTLTPIALLSGLLQAHKLFKLKYEKIVFLLPFQNGFKMMAWLFGFVESHFNSYEPSKMAKKINACL